MLFLGCATSEYWQRTVDGAQDAARALGVELEVRMSTAGESVDQQISATQIVGATGYDGVAITPIDSKSQIESINELAGQMNVVTVDRDSRGSKRLCHIGYAQDSAGRLAAEFVREQLPRPGKIALLATTFADSARNANVTERLAGFKEQWICGPRKAASCTLVPVVAGHDFSAILNDSELVFVVAFDAQAAEFALQALAAQSPTCRVPIVAFEPNKVIFDAIEDGRVSSAIFDDPYRSGFTAVERLRHYRETEKFALPVPGYGNFYLYSEVVRKENVAAIRRRLES